MKKEKLERLRKELIALRDECIRSAPFDPDGAIMLTYASSWFQCKIEGRIFAPDKQWLFWRLSKEESK